jgi:hypothetical protein
MNKIKFVSNRPWLNQESVSKPEPYIKEIPSWYREADRYVKDSSGSFHIGYDGGKIPTWKACPALLDIFSSGYVLKTPCDIEFFLDENEKISVKVKDSDKIDFCTPRAPLTEFVHPQGYYEDHFAWWPDWAVELPEGYSALYTNPLNRFDLPFLMTSGIIDNDKVKLPGTMPFFIVKGFSGTIPAGTPYAQIFPFKREDWESEIVIEDPYHLYDKNAANSKKYRVPDGGVYQKQVWSPRKYK